MHLAHPKVAKPKLKAYGFKSAFAGQGPLANRIGKGYSASNLVLGLRPSRMPDKGPRGRACLN